MALNFHLNDCAIYMKVMLTNKVYFHYLAEPSFVSKCQLFQHNAKKSTSDISGCPAQGHGDNFAYLRILLPLFAINEWTEISENCTAVAPTCHRNGIR